MKPVLEHETLKIYAITSLQKTNATSGCVQKLYLLSFWKLPLLPTHMFHIHWPSD